MRTTSLAALAAAMLLTTTACGGDETTVARDPSPQGPPSPAVPAEVRTTNLAVVMDTGDGPEVCLGPIAESYPPQCGGPTLLGWDWSEHEIHDRQRKVRWGSFLVTGTWDGEALTASDAIPAALYDPMAPEPFEPPTPDPAVPAAELERIAEELREVLPGVQGTYAAETYVMVDVTFDDGSLQEWADDTYGEDVVLVNSALTPVDA